MYDQGTGLAVDAYHRLLGRGVSQQLDAATANLLLNGVGQFKVRFPRNGKHAEGNLTRAAARARQRLQGSTGSIRQLGQASTPTVLGRFRVY